MRSCLVLAFVLAACGDDSSTGVDGGLDVAPIPGDYSCATQALPTTGPDPAQLRGLAIAETEEGIGGVSVTAHDVATDVELASATSASTFSSVGAYAVMVATGGRALRTYRRLQLAGHVDAYGYDPRPTSATPLPVATIVFTPAQLDAYYASAGITRDPAKGTVWLDISDCAPEYIAGATVNAPSGTRFYLDDELAIDPALTATASGSAIILNAEPGEVDIEVIAGPVVYRDWPIVVRAGVLTQSDRLP